MKTPNGAPASWVRMKAIPFEGDECIVFPFKPGKHGYGRVTIRGRQWLMHRFICTIAHGKPPAPDYDAAHACGNRLCGNKRHLRWATRSENEKDKLRHGTALRGERHPQSKLTREQVIAIRAANDAQRRIALKYKITQQTVSDIKTGRRWAWL